VTAPEAKLPVQPLAAASRLATVVSDASACARQGATVAGWSERLVADAGKSVVPALGGLESAARALPRTEHLRHSLVSGAAKVPYIRAGDRSEERSSAAALGSSPMPWVRADGRPLSGAVPAAQAVAALPLPAWTGHAKPALPEVQPSALVQPESPGLQVARPEEPQALPER
jgi:hypothetical protein